MANPEDVNLIRAASYRQIDLVTEALDHGANVNVVTTDSGNTPLHIITQIGLPADNFKLVPLVKLLITRGANLNIQNRDGTTPLMFATTSENTATMKLLLEAGADVTLKHNSGQTALNIARDLQFAEGVALLEGPIQVSPPVVAPPPPRDINKELLRAARRGEVDKVKQLLDEGADVNSKDDRGLSAIMYAVASEVFGVVKELITRGADITVADDNGATPLHLAAYSSEIEILKLIINTHLADHDSLDAKDDHGQTPLHTAAAGGYANSVILLLQNGADATIENNDGITAYDIASSPEIRGLLPPPPARELPAYVSASASAPDPVPIEFEVMKIQFKNQKVYDFEEVEEVPMLSVLSKSNSVIFKAKESYFTLPLTTIVKAIKDGSQIRHRCKTQLEGAPYERDVDMDHMYYYIQGNGNFLVWLDQIQQGLLQDFKIFDLEETDEELDNVASAQNVQTTPGTNRYGNPVNIVSADHCQAGTKQKVFKLTPIIFTEEAQPPPSGEKRRRVEEDQSEASQAADILRGLRTSGGNHRTWKRKAGRKGRKTMKSRK